MAKVKNYILNEMCEEKFSLLAIHSFCEPYLLAFLLNSKCKCRFTKTIKNIREGPDYFPFESYEWIEPINGVKVWLFSNRFQTFQNDSQKGTGLFNIPETKELYLIKDLKDVDLVIKIDSGVEEQLIIRGIESINQVSYWYWIDQSRLNIDHSLNFY